MGVQALFCCHSSSLSQKREKCFDVWFPKIPHSNYAFFVLTSQGSEGTDEVQPFTLDTEFDYDNVALTPKFRMVPGKQFMTINHRDWKKALDGSTSQKRGHSYFINLFTARKSKLRNEEKNNLFPFVNILEEILQKRFHFNDLTHRKESVHVVEVSAL